MQDFNRSLEIMWKRYIQVGLNAKEDFRIIYMVRQKYLTILQNSCEWNRWRGEFVLECPSSETQTI